jgi:hypothetical protein
VSHGPAASAPDLQFAAAAVTAVPAAIPTLRFTVTVERATEARVRGLGLNVALRIAAQRRRYSEEEGERLRELFGPVQDFPRSLGGVPWAQVAINVPGFTGATAVELDVPCTYDFEVAAAKYLAALEGGDVPLELLFSGSMYYSAPDGRLQMAMIPWDREASLRMPLSTWREAVDSAFPDSAWLRVRRDVFARLQAHRSRNGLTTWDETLDSLLGEPVK